MGLDQIGQKLKAAREGQGLSLSQIYERTKIPINHLQSIDNGLADELPEPVYVAGFIKRYADCVGLNGQNLSDEYRRQNGGSDNDFNESPSWSSRLINQPVVLTSSTVRSGLEVRPPSMIKQGLLYAILIVIVLGIMSFLASWQLNSQLNNQPDVATQLLNKRNYNGVFSGAQPTSATTAPIAAPPTEGVQQPGAPTTTPADTETAIAVNASQHVWVEVTALSNGQTLFSNDMERGERKDFKDPEGIRVHAANGASITVENQGKSETLGLAGKIAEKVFTNKAATTDRHCSGPGRKGARRSSCPKSSFC